MFRHELSYYFSTPIAYIVIGLYLLAISLFLWVIPGEWNILESGYADCAGLFSMSPWLLILLCPALTMRLFCEEKQSGTWDVLLSKRVSVARIVWSKFFAAWTITLLAILPCIVHYFVVYSIAEPVGNVDGGAFAGSMTGLVLLSGVFTSLGLLTAAIGRNQIVCFLLGAVLCFVLYWVTLQDHFASISRGVVDVRDVVFFCSIGVSAVLLTVFLLGRKQ